MTYKKSKPNKQKSHKSQTSQPLKTAKLKNASEISPHVTGALDQHGSKWIKIRRNGREALARLDTFMSDQTAFYKVLSDQGMVITAGNVKATINGQIDGMDEWPDRIYVADRPGWHCPIYIMPDGDIIGETPAGFQLEIPCVETLSNKGPLRGWQATVKMFVEDQSTLTLVLALGFVGPVLAILQERENIGINLRAPTSVGKTTALDLKASVWGAPSGTSGSIAAHLRTTINGLEQLMMQRSGAILPLDEANLLGAGSKLQADGLKDIAFMLSSGVDKTRHDNPASTRAHLSFLITSNQPMNELLGFHEQNDAAATNVRLIEVEADAGAGFGVFDRLPNGFSNSGAAIRALQDALAQNHGTASKRYIKSLVTDAIGDPEGLRETIDSYRQTFIHKAGGSANTGARHRVLDAFSTIYAAARLAKTYKVLPLQKVGEPILRCYRRMTTFQTGKSAIDKVRAYVDRNCSILSDLDGDGLKPLTKLALNKHPGFLKTYKGSRCLLVRKAQWEKQFGAQSHRMLKELGASGQLVATDGLQLQTKVRTNRSKDRVYAIVIN